MRRGVGHSVGDIHDSCWCIALHPLKPQKKNKQHQSQTLLSFDLPFAQYQPYKAMWQLHQIVNSEHPSIKDITLQVNWASKYMQLQTLSWLVPLNILTRYIYSLLQWLAAWLSISERRVGIGSNLSVFFNVEIASPTFIRAWSGVFCRRTCHVDSNMPRLTSCLHQAIHTTTP